MKDKLCIYYYSRRFLPVHLDWWRRGRPPARNRRRGSIAPLTVEPFRRGLCHYENFVHGGSDFQGRTFGNHSNTGPVAGCHVGKSAGEGHRETRSQSRAVVCGAYSACYHGALGNAAKKLGTPVKDSTVRALVSLIEDDQGGYRLAVELHAQLPGTDRAQVQRIMDEAHKTCPYSKPCARHLRQAGGGLTGRARTRAAKTLLPSCWRRIKTKNNKSQTIMTTLEIKGDWNITKGKLKQKWPRSRIAICNSSKASRKNCLAAFRSAPAKPAKRRKGRQGILLLLLLQLGCQPPRR